MLTEFLLKYHNEPAPKTPAQLWKVLHLLPGEVVEVKEAGEIETTLDAEGKLMGLLFTEEMRSFCGRKFRVFRRADKACVDTIGLRRFNNMVMLSGVYCNGIAHGGCDRTCRLFWHEAWLRRSDNTDGLEPPSLPSPEKKSSTSENSQPAEEYLHCQSTELMDASKPLSWADPSQYVLDLLNYPVRKMLNLAWVMIHNKIGRWIGLREWRRLLGYKKDTLDINLCLHPGEYVRMKSAAEIASTLDIKGKNRGLEFMPEMTQLCGKTFQVYKRVDRLVHEKTGRVHRLRNTVLLENGTCDGMSHRGCPRDCFFLVREIWLERVDPWIQRCIVFLSFWQIISDYIPFETFT